MINDKWSITIRIKHLIDFEYNIIYYHLLTMHKLQIRVFCSGSYFKAKNFKKNSY